MMILFVSGKVYKIDEKTICVELDKIIAFFFHVCGLSALIYTS